MSMPLGRVLVLATSSGVTQEASDARRLAR